MSQHQCQDGRCTHCLAMQDDPPDICKDKHYAFGWALTSRLRKDLQRVIVPKVSMVVVRVRYRCDCGATGLGISDGTLTDVRCKQGHAAIVTHVQHQSGAWHPRYMYEKARNG